MSNAPELLALLDEVRPYPGVSDPVTLETNPARLLFLPMEFTTVDGRDLTFFSTLATFGTALDVTLAELSIEAFFPADSATRAALQA